MSRRKQAPVPTGSPTAATADWATSSGRVKWLVETKFGGNRSAFATAVGLSHTAVNKVVSGQEVGRKFVSAVVEKLKVSSAWMWSGVGQPFVERPGSSGGVEVPVSLTLLPGSPLAHQELLTGWIDVPSDLFAPSQYWLLLTSAQPLVRDASRGFRAGDQLLMETDRTRFPRERQLCERLCIVPSPSGSPQLVLGAVTHHDADPDTGPERLEVDTFDLEIDPASLVREDVYRHYPGGEIRHHRRRLKIVEHRGGPLAVPLSDRDQEPNLPTIRYSDIVAVWLQLLRRSRGVG